MAQRTAGEELNRPNLSEHMKTQYLLMLALLIAFSASAQQDGKRVYQKDSTGNTLYHKQSWVIVKGQMCPVDTVGSRQYNKPCLDIGSKTMDQATQARNP
jgi:hypothetical protein